jgi:hypothetical protein
MTNALVGHRKGEEDRVTQGRKACGEGRDWIYATTNQGLPGSNGSW